MTRFAARAFLFSLLIIPALMDQARCQTLAAPLQDSNPQFLDCRGVGNAPCPPLAGGKLWSYDAGTNDARATCATTTLSGANCATPNANPVILNSYGYNAAGSGTTGIWPLPARCYKFKLTDSSNNTIWTIDNVCNQTGVLQAALVGGSGATLVGFTPTGGVPITVAGALNSTFLYDSGYSSFLAACAAAVSNSKALAITKAWTVPTGAQSCAAPLIFFTGAGGSIVTSSGTVLSLPVPALCGASAFNVATGGSGSVRFTGDPFNQGSNPRCFGAKGDGSTDDGVALQASITATEIPGGTITTSAKWVLPVGNYHYSTGLVSLAWGARLEGASKYDSILTWTGSTGHAFTTEGFFVTGGNFQISNGGTGWTEAFDWEGSNGTIGDLVIDCQSKPGNGMTAASQAIHQSDQLSINKPYIANCNSGHGFQSFSANAVSINLYNPTIGGNWIGIQSNTSSNLGIFGGEIDTNDVNFVPGAGSTFLVSGVRSENSKRSFFSSVGVYAQPFTLISYDHESATTTRTGTTATGSSGSAAVTLSNSGYTFGDWVNFAGESGSPDHQITAMSDTTHITAMGGTTLASSISGAAVTLSSHQQNDFEEHGAGPYIHIGNTFNGTADTFTVASGPQTFTSNTWTINIPTPTNATLLSSTILLLSNTSNATTPMVDYDPAAVNPGCPYAIDASVADNALIVSTLLNRADGLCVKVKLKHTLQAGANTLAYNAFSAGGIKSAITASDIAEVLPVNTILTFTYDSSFDVWLVQVP